MKKHLIALSVIFSLFAISSNATTIGVLDVEKIIQESKAMRDIQRKVNKKQSSYQKEVTKKQQNLEKEQKRIEGKKTVLSQKALAKEIDAFEKKVNDLKTYVDRRQNTLKKASLDGMSKVQDIIKVIIEEIAKEKGLDLIVPATQTLFHKTELDISKEVLKRLDKKINKVKVKF